MLRSLLNRSSPTLCARIYEKGFESFYHCSKTLHPNLPVFRPPQLSLSTKVQDSSSNSESQPVVVYVGELQKKVHRVKTFSLCSSLLGICAQPVLMARLETMGELILANTFIGFFTFVTPVLLHLVTRRYVTKVVYDPTSDTYTASFISFFLLEKKFTFGPGEAEVPDIPVMFTTFKIRGIPMMVDVHDFDVTHYSRILGYDKPLDFKLPKDDSGTAPDVTAVNEVKGIKKE